MNRRYDLDWLRVIAFGILMVFHTGMGFTSYDWHVKNYESSRFLDELIAFVHQWRMPLLFFISGAAVWFAMEKYSTWRYLGERQKRLLVPLVVGMLVVIPPQVYWERVYQRAGYGSFLDFYPTVFTSGSYPQGNLSWHHLWYIPYIWAFSMITVPVFAWLRSGSGRALIERVQSFFTRRGVLFLIFIPSAVAELALRPFYPGDYHNLFSDWANFVHKLTFFVAGFVLASGAGLADVIAARRRHYLGAALAAAAVMEVLWHGSWRMPTVPYRLLANFHMWMWILAALGFGRRYLNVNSASLRYATNAVYPFYILHQTVIVMLLLPLVYVDLGMWTKYALVLAGTGFITWGIHEGLISRVNVLRVCFGLKAKSQPRNSVLPSAGPEASAAPGCAAGGGAPGPPGPGATLAGVLVAAVALGLATRAAHGAETGKLVPLVLTAPSLASNRFEITPTQPIAVYLPPSYSAGKGTRFPVIYLLPNFNTPVWRYTAGNYQRFRLREGVDALIRARRMPETIVVVPNATHFLGGSWYRNSTLTGNWEDYITRDLVGCIDTRFPTLARPQSRALAGHGTGGTGALELALKHPDVFGAVYAMSPAILGGEDLHWFAGDGDRQAAEWEARIAEWTHADEKSVLKDLRLYMQERLNGTSRASLFEALRLSCAAAIGRPTTLPPFIEYPTPRSRDLAARERFWSDIMGGWEMKVEAYLKQPHRLSGITIEYGRYDEYDFIRRGAEHVAEVLRSLGVPNSVTVSEGGHDSTLGQRFERGMLPSLGTAMKTAD